MQVDDEHLSLTDQKDQVRDPLQVDFRWICMSQAGKQEGREAPVGGRGNCGRPIPVFPLRPVPHRMGPLWAALVKVSANFKP